MKHIYGWLEEMVTRNMMRRAIRQAEWCLWLHHKADHGKHTDPEFRR